VAAEQGEAVWWHCETVTLTMRSFSDSFLRDYLDAEWEQIRWSVGGYRIEGPGAQLFERVEGSHFAILGLPLLPLLGYLRERGLLPS
jgi:septum formation protein